MNKKPTRKGRKKSGNGGEGDPTPPRLQADPMDSRGGGWVEAGNPLPGEGMLAGGLLRPFQDAQEPAFRAAERERDGPSLGQPVPQQGVPAWNREIPGAAAAG